MERIYKCLQQLYGGGKHMEMIKIGWSMVLPLQDAFMRNRTFYWAVMAIMGFCSRQDSLGGVTSWVRCTGVNPDKYTQFVGLFHLLGKKGSSRSC